MTIPRDREVEGPVKDGPDKPEISTGHRIATGLSLARNSRTGPPVSRNGPPISSQDGTHCQGWRSDNKQSMRLASMREYGQVQCAIWGHPDFSALSDHAKLLYLYLLTGPHSNGLGCYRLPFGYVSSDTGNPFDTVSECFSELQKNHSVHYCEATEFVLIGKYLKWNPVSNPKVAQARQKEFLAIPSKFQYFQELAQDVIAFGKHFDEPFLNHIERLVRARSETVSKQDPTRPDPKTPQPGQDACVPKPEDFPDGLLDPETGELLRLGEGV